MSESEQDSFMAMAGALARLLRRMDEEEGLPDENQVIYPDSTCKCVGLANSPNRRRQCSDNAKSPQFRPKYQSNISASKNFNYSPRPWHGNTASNATTRDIVYTNPSSPIATPSRGNDKQPMQRVSNERRRSFNRIARPFKLERLQARVHSPVAVPLSTSNNCSSTTSPMSAHYDVVVSGSGISEDILLDNQWTTISVESKRPLDLHKDSKNNDDLTDIKIEKTPLVRQMKININSEELTEKDLATEVHKNTPKETKPAENLFVSTSVEEICDTDFDFLEPASPYSLSPQGLGDITLTPSMLTQAKNGVYRVGPQRYVTLAHSNAQLDGGVCSVGTTFEADQLHDLYKNNSGVYADEQQLDKHMMSLQIEHLAKYTSSHKPNDHIGVDFDEQSHFVEYSNFTKDKYSKLPIHVSYSQESLLSWQDCRSTLDSDEENDQLEGNVYTTALNQPSYSSSFDEDTLREPVQLQNLKEPDINLLCHNDPVCPTYDKTIYDQEELFLDDNQSHKNVLADPYLNISRQWSWYPYKENETPGKTTSPRRKKIILTPCSKHSSKKSNLTFQSEPFQYGDCEECSEYIRNIKLIVETSRQSDLSSKAFLRKLMEPACGVTTRSPSDLSLYRLVENKVTEDMSKFSDSQVFVDDASMPNVDMAGDDSKCKGHATNVMNATEEEKRWLREYVSEDQTPKGIKTFKNTPKYRSYKKIAKTVVWNVLLNAVAKIVVNKVIYKAFQSMKASTTEVKYDLISESPIVIDHNNYFPDDESCDSTELSNDESEKFASTTSFVFTEGESIGEEIVLDAKLDSKLQIQTLTLVSPACEQTIRKDKAENNQTIETQPSDNECEEFSATTSFVSSEAELVEEQKLCSIAPSYEKEKQQEQYDLISESPIVIDHNNYFPDDESRDLTEPSDDESEKFASTTSFVSTEGESIGEEMVLNAKLDSKLQIQTLTLVSPACEQTIRKCKAENDQTIETQPSDNESEVFSSTTSFVSSAAELAEEQKLWGIAPTYEKVKQQEHNFTYTVLDTKSDSMDQIQVFLPTTRQMLSSTQPNDNESEKVGVSTSCVSVSIEDEEEEEELTKIQRSYSVLSSYKNKVQRTSKLTDGEERVGLLNTKSESELKFETSTLCSPTAGQSLPSTEARDTSGLSLSDMTFKNLNYVKDKLLSVRYTMTNIVKTYVPDGGSPAVYPDEKIYDDFGRSFNHLACDVTSEVTKSEIGSTVTTTGLHQTRVRSTKHIGQNNKRWGNTIPTTCNCCNKYICILNENIKHACVKEIKSVSLDNEENTSCGLVIHKNGDNQIRHATTITPDDYCEETEDHPAWFSSSELHDQTMGVKLSSKVVNMDTGSSKCYSREEPSVDFVEFDEEHAAPPAGIDTKIYVWEKFKDFRPLPKPTVVIASPETPTRERVEYFEGLMKRKPPCYDKVDDVVGKDNIEEKHFPEIREVILDVAQQTNGASKKIEEDKIESPGSFTIFQAFFDALHSPLPSDEESPAKTDTTLYDKPTASCGHTFQKDVNDYEERETEMYKDIALKSCLNHPIDVTNSNCDKYLWNSSISKFKENEELVEDMVRKTSDDSFHSAKTYENTSLTSECKPNDSKKLNKNNKKRGYGFFRRFFTKKHKTKTSTKNKEEKIEKFQDENLDQHRDGQQSDIEWDDDVVAVDTIIRTDGESSMASLADDHYESCVENIDNPGKYKDVKKKRKPSFLMKFRRSLIKKGGLADGAVSKTGNSDPNNETTTSKNLSGTFGKNKPSHKTRLFSFKDVKRSQEKADSKSSRHPLK